MPHCKNCKYWKPVKGMVDGFGHCKNIELGKNDLVLVTPARDWAGSDADENDDVEVLTAETFGCVLWAERAKEGENVS